MIGVFDSGVGGLTVLQHIHERLPQYSTMYLGDAARSPYGTKTHEEITQFAWEGVKWLFDQGCPLVIVACNSASAQALRTIQQTKLQEYPGHRVLGVIRPTVEDLAERYGHIGILATPATVGSKAYVRELKHISEHVHVSQHACPEWVNIVEQGQVGTPESEAIIKQDIEAALQQDPSIEAVLLGCTHYPVLFETIRKLLPEHIDLYEQGPLVAASLEDYLRRHSEIEEKLEKGGTRSYFTTGDPVQAAQAAAQIAGMQPTFKRVEKSSKNR